MIVSVTVDPALSRIALMSLSYKHKRREQAVLHKILGTITLSF